MAQECVFYLKNLRAYPYFKVFYKDSGEKVKVYLNLLRSGKPLVSKTGKILSSPVLSSTGCQTPTSFQTILSGM